MQPLNAIPDDERLIFALDVPTSQEAFDLIDELGDAVSFYKVGAELWVGGAPGYANVAEAVVDRGKKVMVDLKFFDVPETVGRAVRRLADFDVSFATVHGNDDILRAAVNNRAGGLRLLAVTVLTSLDRHDLDDLGFRVDVESLVLSRARRALEIGCDGLVSSGLEAPALRRELGDGFVVVTPGIRPVVNRHVDDQKRTVDVEEAFRNGADYIVVGRPIRDAADRRAAALDIRGRVAAAVAGGAT